MNAVAHITSHSDVPVKSELRKFQYAAERSPSQLVITDRDGRIEYVNPKFVETTGFQPHEVLGRTPSLLNSGETPQSLYERLWSTILSGNDWSGEILNRRRDGSLFWEMVTIAPILDASGAVSHFCKMSEDITSRKRDEYNHRRNLHLSEAVTAANLKFIETGDITQMSVILLDAWMTITNSPFGMLCELLPSGNAAVLSLSLASFDPIAEVQAFRDMQQEIRRSGYCELYRHDSLFFSLFETGESVIADGASIARSESDCPCPLCSCGKITSFVAIPLKVGATLFGAIVMANRTGGYDRDEVLELEGDAAQTCTMALAGARAEIDRKKAIEQLRQAQKMEAIGQLAGGIAHDFNNLLTVINGYSTLLLQRVSDDTQRRDIEQILNAGERATTLIRQLLAFGRRQILEPRLLNVNGLITGLHKILCRLIGENIDLLTNLSQDTGMVKADASQIEQIIMNLIINARDAMRRGGKIYITTSNCVLDGAYTSQNPGSLPGDYVMISVRDTGIGIRSDLIARIFEPFFTTKEPGSGTGLGLATVYGIVKQSNGYIQVLSEVGLGSDFRVYLPRVTDEELLKSGAPPLVALPAATLRNGHKERVLIVEDERSVLEMAAMTLSSCGYEVFTASCPTEAFALLEELEEGVDLLLSDVIMPGMSGPDMATIMKKQLPDLKIVFMSGYTDEHLKESCVAAEQCGFIMKPFTMPDLAAIVHSAIAATPLTTYLEPLHE